MEMQKIGSWAFIIGVVIAIILGVLGAGVFGGVAQWIPLLFVVLGIIIGLLNIKDKEMTHFLVAVIALLAVGSVQWSLVPVVGSWLGPIFAGIATLMAPAAVIVAIKAVWDIAKN
ncbi:MAG: hypothetical protein IPJ89_01735 [Candidatus Iainarchaeum archaeon]|uniref:Uncharacterized protein n=1 Tax=Candidatus Iainarchaeum sp. TaxID=3101447 RepID=A0A7T9DKV5_9ARCH|nr:MAG: hypothetical protein IPJ89_01735 [Candidatus Diapherotrites archaeon]